VKVITEENLLGEKLYWTINSQNTVCILRADTENCSSTLIPNVGNYVPNYTASHSRRQIL